MAGNRRYSVGGRFSQYDVLSWHPELVEGKQSPISMRRLHRAERPLGHIHFIISGILAQCKVNP